MLDKKEYYAWRTGRKCVFKNFVHLIFVTKYRRGVFTKEMLVTLKAVFKETTTQMGAELIEFGGEDDHVHLMLSYPPKVALSNLVGKLKGKSSYILRRDYCLQKCTLRRGMSFIKSDIEGLNWER